MKNTFSTLAVALAFILLPLYSAAQVINWQAWQPEQKHLVNLYAGVDYGLVFGATYGYKWKTKLPFALSVAFSVPAGKTRTDDFKTQLAGQICLAQAGDFRFSAELRGVFRRTENAYVRLLNFGSALSGTAGYYKNRWFVAAGLGFDKAFVTHFQHTPLMRENYPAIQDGWYGPSTGGNFSLGVQCGYSFNRLDVYLTLGKLLAEDFQTIPLTRFYGQVGVNGRF